MRTASLVQKQLKLARSSLKWGKVSSRIAMALMVTSVVASYFCYELIAIKALLFAVIFRLSEVRFYQTFSDVTR